MEDRVTFNHARKPSGFHDFFIILFFYFFAGIFGSSFAVVRPIAHYVSKRRFSSRASAAIQDSAAPPSVRSLCRSAARSYLCRLASEARVAWKRADPIFDVLRLVLTNQSKNRGATPALYRNIKTV